MARRRRNPLLLAALAILFFGAGTAATLLLQRERPPAGPPREDPLVRPTGPSRGAPPRGVHWQAITSVQVPRGSGVPAEDAVGSLHVRWTGPAAEGNWFLSVVRLPKSTGAGWNRSARGFPPEVSEFGPMKAGRYEVSVRGPAGIGEAEAVVLPGAVTEVAIGPMLPGDPREGPVLAGEVVDASGTPVAGAWVAVLLGGRDVWRSFPSQPVSSPACDGTGRFRVRVRVEEGSPCWIRATARGFAPGAAGPFAPTTEGIRVVLDATGSVEGRILPPPGVAAPRELLLGFRCDPEPGAPAVAVVGEPVHRATTGFRDGLFLLRGLPPGRGTLIGSVDGIPFDPVEVVIRAGETTDAGIIKTQVPRRITGRVTDREGFPLPGAFVRVEGDLLDLPGLPSAGADAEGRFLIEGVSPGEVLLRVRRPPAPAPAPAPGSAPAPAPEGAPSRGVGVLAVEFTPAGTSTRRRNLDISLTVPVPAGGDADVGDIVLPGPGLVTGRALDAGGGPAVGARVETAQGDFTVVDAAGEFRLALPPGEHDILLRLPGAAEPAARATVTVPDGGTVTVELRAAR